MAFKAVHEWAGGRGVRSIQALAVTGSAGISASGTSRRGWGSAQHLVASVAKSVLAADGTWKIRMDWAAEVLVAWAAAAVQVAGQRRGRAWAAASLLPGTRGPPGLVATENQNQNQTRSPTNQNQNHGRCLVAGGLFGIRPGSRQNLGPELVGDDAPGFWGRMSRRTMAHDAPWLWLGVPSQGIIFHLMGCDAGVGRPRNASLMGAEQAF